MMPYPRKMTDQQRRDCLHYWCHGVRQVVLAKKYGVAVSTICALIKKLQARPA